MSSMLELPVGDDPVAGVIGSYEKNRGPKCPKCESRDTQALSRDPLWEETHCRCNACDHRFTNG